MLDISKKSKAVIDDLNQQIKELKTKYEQMWKVQQQMMVFLSTFLKEYSHLNGSPTQLAIGDNVNGSSTSSNRQQIAQYPANADSFPPESSQVLPEISNHNFQQIKKLLDQSSSFGNQIANPRPSINPTLLVGFNDTLQNQDHSGLSAESKSASSVQLFSHQGNLPKHSSSFLSRLPSVQLASSPAFSSYGAIPSSSSLPSLSSQGAPSIAMASIHEVDTLSAPVSRMIEFPNGYSAASDLSQSKSVLDSPTFSRNSRGFLNSPVGPMQNQSLSSSPQFASLPSPMRRSSARLDSLSPIGRLTNSPLMDDDLRDEPLPASPFGMGSNEALDMLNPDEFL